MYHVFALLQHASTARPSPSSREPDQIVAPGSLEPFDERAREAQLRETPIPSKLIVLALVELLLPASGLFLGLQLWNGSWWWLLVGAGILLSVLVGYAFRSDIQLHPLDLSRR
jgi:hypothetical protein